MDHAVQLPSRRDMDLSHTETSHDSADVGHQRHADHESRLATFKERKSAERSAMATGDKNVNKETRRDLYLVGRRTIGHEFIKYLIFCKKLKYTSSVNVLKYLNAIKR